MNTDQITPSRIGASVKSFGSAVDSLCKSILFKKLSGIRTGRLVIKDGPDVRFFGETSPADGRSACITVLKSSFYTRAALGGSSGAGESYAAADWECDNLPGLVRIFVANRDQLNSLDSGVGALIQPLERLLHKARKNTVETASDNIKAHYDLGNDFFSLFLDETMMYSCGIFANENSSLFEASTEKNDRICRKLGLTPKDHVLEIGTGWGGFAVHAAKNYGCKITTTTISPSQFKMAEERVQKAGVGDRVTLLLEDYRHLKGTYDKLVSIEMVEAVGLDHLGTYFETCGARLKPSGSMLLQAIIIRDQYYEQARKSVDFIQKHIFPGSGIPSISSLVNAAADNTDMRLFHQEDITAHYVPTLRAWSERLRENKQQMIALGYPEHLYRLWQFYFGYCEGGFHEKSIGLVQMLFTKPQSEQPSILGLV